jgi:hypothetical protein
VTNVEGVRFEKAKNGLKWQKYGLKWQKYGLKWQKYGLKWQKYDLKWQIGTKKAKEHTAEREIFR